MKLRQHQTEMLAICDRILAGAPIAQILCGVTPGGGKSLLPQILAHQLIPEIADKLCWVVPRLALQDQGARGYNDPANRNLIGHTLEAMTSTNCVNPTRGCSTYVTTYQAIAADKGKVNAREFKKHKYILVLDEPHHIEDSGLWHEALQPLYERAVLVCLMSGTFERGDGNPIAFVPYVEREDGMAIDFEPSETKAVIRYGLRDAWKEQAVIDLDVQYVDCAAHWRDRQGREHHVKSLRQAAKQTPQALYTALHSEAALELLTLGVESWEKTRAENPRAKLLVVAATIEQAKRYTTWFEERRIPVKIATSDDSDAAHLAIKQFKRTGSGGLNALITVAMAYEGLDVPAITHLICLTHIRTKPWIEQVVHRATRVDYGAGPYHVQKAQIFAPDDAPFRACMDFLFAEREKFRACLPAEAMDEGRLPEDGFMPGDLFGGGGLYPGMEILGSSVVGVRRDPILEHVRKMWAPSFEELTPSTPGDRMTRLRQQIEKICRRYERQRNLRHGSVNRAIYRQFKKSRETMTEEELVNVRTYAEKHYT